ncbi:MAG: hypothetical protein ABFS86_02935 [Planctomycetota bacterium]
MSTGIRIALVALAVAAVLAAGWIVLRPVDGPVGPGGDPDTGDGAGNGIGDGSGNEEHRLPPPPPPGAAVAGLLGQREKNPERARRELSELAATAAGVREIVGAIGTSTSATDRALLYLHLVLGGTTEGLAHARKAADGDGRAEDRIPVIYALAAGDDTDVERIAGLLSAPADGELFRAAVFALALRGDDAALLRLEAVLAGSPPEARRRVFYASLNDGPSRPEAGFLELLRESMPGLGGGDLTRPGYRRFIDRVSREDVPAVVPQAAELLLRLPGPEAQQGVRDLWQRAEDDVRSDLAETILVNLDLERPGATRTIVVIARGLGEDAEPHERERVRSRIGEIRDAGALPELREWLGEEEDPETRQALEEAIHRLEAESEGR